MLGNLPAVLRSFRAKLFPEIRPAFNRLPLTLALFCIILVIGVVTQTIGRDYWPVLVRRGGWDLITLQHGRIYTAWVGLFFSVLPGDFYGILLLLLLMVGPLEYRRGTGLAAFSFFVVGPLASIITLLVLWPFSLAGIQYVRVALYSPDMGASTACLVCLGNFLIREKGLWRNIFLYGVLAVLGGLFYRNSVYNIDHLFGYLIGLGTGAIMVWWEKRKRARLPGGKVPVA
jgi:hypothetical protein